MKPFLWSVKKFQCFSWWSICRTLDLTRGKQTWVCAGHIKHRGQSIEGQSHGQDAHMPNTPAELACVHSCWFWKSSCKTSHPDLAYSGWISYGLWISDKIPDKCNLRKGFLLWLIVQGSSSGGEVMAAGTWGNRSHRMILGSREADVIAGHGLPLTQFRTQAQAEWCRPLLGVSPRPWT